MSSEAIKTYEVVIKMAFLVLKKKKISPKNLENDSENLNSSKWFWKFIPLNMKMLLKIWTISVLLLGQ